MKEVWGLFYVTARILQEEVRLIPATSTETVEYGTQKNSLNSLGTPFLDDRAYNSEGRALDRGSWVVVVGLNWKVLLR